MMIIGKRFCRIRQLDDWRAQKLFDVLDKRRNHAEYAGNEAAKQYNVLVIGAGESRVLKRFFGEKCEVTTYVPSTQFRQCR